MLSRVEMLLQGSEISDTRGGCHEVWGFPQQDITLEAKKFFLGRTQFNLPFLRCEDSDHIAQSHPSAHASIDLANSLSISKIGNATYQLNPNSGSGCMLEARSRQESWQGIFWPFSVDAQSDESFMFCF